MDMISSTTSNTTAQSAEQNKQEASMVASPPTEEAAAATNIQANQLAWQQQVLARGGGGERKPRPLQEQGLTCPRCNSTNTKFCYYNNNNLGQRRYSCKGCRRNWTQGGTLRNVPVGGRTRKNKPNHAGGSSSSAAPSSSSNESKKVMNLTQQLLMLPTATAPMPADFPSVLPAFMTMAGGFELPSSDYHSLPLFPPLSPLFNPGTTLLESLTEGFLDSGSNGMASAPLLFGTSDQQLVGLLQGVDQALEFPMAAAGGSGLQQWPSLAANKDDSDGSANNNDDNNATNNNGGGASGGSSGIEYYCQGSI